MYQYEAVIKVMEDNGGYATLGHLYQNALKVPGSKWQTKTPYASIRRIVQDARFFFRIRPGLWALKSHRDLVLTQGLIVEIGNIKGYQTFVPRQDKNKKYLSKPLSEYATLDDYHKFTYRNVLDRAVTIDVTWFNDREFPHAFFEVEHTTDIQGAILKFVELQDFYSKFFIVSAAVRKAQFQKKIEFNAFQEIKDRVKFLDYKFISDLHSSSVRLHELELEQSPL
jgi:hypothetical protein